MITCSKCGNELDPPTTRAASVSGGIMVEYAVPRPQRVLKSR